MTSVPPGSALPRVGLDALPPGSELMRRRDRRYIARAATLAGLTEQVRGSHAVLEVAGTTVQRYESLYYDTAAFDLLHDHRRGRSRRTKVRRRHYASTGAWMLEFKLRTPAGATVKTRLEIPEPRSDVLDARERAWLTATARAHGSRHADTALEPVLWTVYDRTTLVALDGSERATIDARLTFAAASGARGARMRADELVIEVKSERARTPSDAALVRLGARRGGQSKYATGAVLVHRPRRMNAFHLFARRHFEPVEDGRALARRATTSQAPGSAVRGAQDPAAA